VSLIPPNTKIYKLLKFVGRKALFWISVNVSSSVLMVGIEFALSLSIALLINSLGINSQPILLPFGLSSLNFGRKEFIAILIFIGFARSVTQFIINQTSTYSDNVIGLRLNQLLLLKYFKGSNFDGSIAEYHHYSRTIFSRASAFCRFGMQIIPSLIQSTLIVAILAYKNLELTTAGVIGLGTSGLLISFASKQAVNFSTIIRDFTNSWNKRIVRTIRNWNMLRALRLLEQEHHLIAMDQFTEIALHIRTDFFSTIIGTLPQLFGILVITGLITLQLNFPRMSGIEFFGYLYLFLRFAQTLGNAVSTFGQLATSYPQFKTAIKFFFSFTPEQITEAVSNIGLIKISGSNWSTVGKEAIDSKKTKKKNKEFIFPEPPEIILKDVSFTYEEGAQVLSKVNIVVPSCSSLAIVGPSGSGKSTLLSLILGVNTPQHGLITIGGLKPEEYFEKYSQSVSYVGADPYLMEGSIKENILFGNSLEITNDDIMKALTFASLSNWVNILPQGLNYHITENGDGLSTGQKQRLSLARAFLRRPSLLVLDEISANLDLTTEKEIATTLEQMNYNATILIVSHRSGLVEHITNRINLNKKN
jgi:ABC-type multidrug transport system fused ATPase/permease subunit